MNFEFSPEQRLVQEEARRLFQETCPVSEVRAVLEGRAPYAPETWKRLGELGFLGAAIPERFGGSGMSHYELCLIAEEAGRVLAPVPLSSSIYSAAEALLVAGSDRQKAALLPEIAAGKRIATVAFSDLGRVDDMEDGVRLEKDRLTGVKLPVADGEVAALAIVRAAASAGPTLAIVELDQPGVVREPVTTVDPTRPHARLRFDAARAEILGEPGAGDVLVEKVRDRAAILVGFEQLGGADRALEMAREYAMTRFTFNRLIGSYQAIKHKLADMYVRNQIARGHCYYGAWALASGAAELPLAAAGVRIAATNALHLAAQENIQTHGGIGFTWEADCHLFYRRARLLALELGALRDWKHRLVRLLDERKAA